MTDLKQLEERLDRLQSEIELTKKEIENMKSKGNVRQRVEKEEYYSFIDDWGRCELVQDERCEEDDYRFNTGNYIPGDFTEDKLVEAQLELKKKVILARQKIKDFAMSRNEEIDWNDRTQLKYYPYYDHHSGVFTINYNRLFQGVNEIYFTSKEAAQECIDTMEEELMLVLNNPWI